MARKKITCDHDSKGRDIHVQKSCSSNKKVAFVKVKTKDGTFKKKYITKQHKKVCKSKHET